MDAYMLIEAEISDPVQFAEYAQAVPRVVERYGGEYRVVGGMHVPLEGDWGNTRLVISRWPSVEAAQEFWDSDEYAEVRKLREDTGEFRVMVIEALPEDKVDRTDEEACQ